MDTGNGRILSAEDRTIVGDGVAALIAGALKLPPGNARDRALSAIAGTPDGAEPGIGPEALVAGLEHMLRSGTVAPRELLDALATSH